MHHRAAPREPVHATAPQSQVETAADRAAEERVHAWYKTLHAVYVPTAKTEDDAAPEQAAPAKQSAKQSTATPATSPPGKPVPVTIASWEPGTVSPEKPSVIDLDHAAQRQSEAVHAPAAGQARTSTSDDAAAIAEESHIPSTAPTERVAAPFTHGDFLVSMPGAVPNQHPFTQPAAPILSASSPAGNALLASAAKKAKPDQAKPDRPKLDSSLVNGMTVETFAGAESPAASAGAATVLAGNGTKADPMVKPALPPLDENAANAASLVKVNLFDSAGKLILIPAMKGTHEILVHQNQMAAADGLERIQNDAQLIEMRRARQLVALPETDGIGVDERLPLNRRYARSWTVHFLNDLSRAHYARFHSPLIVTSAARTVAFQRRLVLTNGNAAPPTGEIASPHLYGQAVDIAKHGMSITEIAWMRAYLTPVETEGKIDVEEEFQQACFHVSVYRRYLGLPTSKPAPTQETAPARRLEQVKATPPPGRHRHLPTALLATGLR